VKARPLGATGLEVSPVGLGAGQLGDDLLDEADAARLVHAAVDLGITLVDTARSYGASEERLGRHLGPRRRRVVLSTKLGYGVAGVPDWTLACVRAGVDAALARLGTDWIDVVHLHSCPRAVLERGEVVEALAGAVRAGKVRVAAYSGDGDALAWAVRSGAFGAVQCSLSVADQAVLGATLAEARARGLGVLVKRPLANAAWRHQARPAAPDVAAYWERLGAMVLPDDGLDPAERSLRFVLSQPGVHAALVGSANVQHLARAVAWAGRGPLPIDAVARLRGAFTAAAAAPPWREWGAVT
jgi:aryl-alcohol dehydrogenase-like predicted oxidoreductase